jgi:hypothetical protein
MKLESLKTLHQSMLSLGLDMQHFQMTAGAAHFDCLFSTREEPFILSLTSRGENPKFFKFDVLPGYWIKDYFGDMYHDLLTVLRIDGRSGEKLIPSSFLAQLDQKIPRIAKKANVPSPDEVLRLRHDVEERDRPYFNTWIYWDKEKGKSSPSEENRSKTLLIMGIEAHQYSVTMNASSKWSATPTGRTWSPT